MARSLFCLLVVFIRVGGALRRNRPAFQALVDIVVRLETAFSVQISFDELELEDIESVRTLARVVKNAGSSAVAS